MSHELSLNACFLSKLFLKADCCLQTGHDGSHTDNNSDHQAPAVTSQASRSQQPSWASSAPSAGWSTSSPAAGWGSSTGTGKQLSGNQTEGSSGQGFLQKAQEYLPGLSTGQTGSAAESGTQDASKDGSQQSLLDKAKEYLPGSSSTKTTDSAWKSDSSQLQEREQMPDIPVVRLTCSTVIITAPVE